ncbi:hypothetical protein [Streptomyces violaceus]|uniref:Integral membrane protein n=1 Tax=Streptomyces violaceus TaxID=1936 RepID=A0ABY9UMT2_STRVL|nr:hypothetical protein [Streptomyces janthinus]WND23577.1 hypothetical protein RI060_42425 [Streptomyces janthinus]GGS95757.1 hypothetical protein GCM10010270_79670 [Streptomyces janthinus]
MASPPADDQDVPAPLQTRERPSRLIDIMVALLLLVADAVIVVVAAMLFVMVGMGSTSAHSSPTAHSRDVPVLTWLAIWGFPAVAATSGVVHARLRMPVTAAVQSLFTLACTFLAVIWTRMLLS